MTAEQVTAIAGIAQAVGILVALFFARRQIDEVVESRREQSRPYITVALDFPDDRRPFPDLVVTNLGQTAAYNVRFSFSPALRSSLDDGPGTAIADVGLLKNGIPVLVPNQRIAALFDSMMQRSREWEAAYSVIVRYQDRFGSDHDDRYTLDLAPFYNVSYVETKGLKSIHGELERLRKVVEKLGSSSHPLNVVSESPADRQQRLEEARSERTRRSTTENASPDGP